MTKSDCENCIHAKHTEGKRTYMMDDGRAEAQAAAEETRREGGKEEG